MKIILLTKEQADKIRGNHGKYSALDPVLADNGMYILPTEVLDDPEHKEVLDKLGECKYANIDVMDEIDEKLPVGDPERIKQVLSVKELSPVSIVIEKEMIIKPIYEKVAQQIIKKII